MKTRRASRKEKKNSKNKKSTENSKIGAEVARMNGDQENENDPRDQEERTQNQQDDEAAETENVGRMTPTPNLEDDRDEGQFIRGPQRVIPQRRNQRDLGQQTGDDAAYHPTQLLARGLRDARQAQDRRQTRQEFRREESPWDEIEQDVDPYYIRRPHLNPENRGGRTRNYLDRNNSSRVEPRKLQIRPETYSGDQDLEAYIQHFESCAKVGRWTEEEKAWTLVASLRGSAQRFVASLPEETKNNFQELTDQLRQRFGIGSRHSIFWRTKFEARTRESNETISDLVDNLLLMASRAFPNLDSETQQFLAMQQLMKSLEPEVRLKCIERNINTLRQVEELVEMHETVMGRKEREGRRTAVRAMFENEVKEQEKEPMPRKQRGNCYCCQSNEHYFHECPVYKRCKEAEERWNKNWGSRPYRPHPKE